MYRKRGAQQQNIIIVVSALIILYLSGCSKEKGVLIVVINQSESRIRNLKLSFSGGCITKDALANEDMFSANVNPTTESALSVQFLDEKGRLIEKTLDVYIEKNYTGRIVITIEPDYGVVMKQNVGVSSSP